MLHDGTTSIVQSCPYDNRAYAIVDDNSSSTVQTVVYMISLFESMAEVYIQLDGQDAWEMYANELIVSDLPDVWVNLASNGGKRNRQVI
jgi:hypothetical protein